MNQQDLNAKRAINSYLKGLDYLKEHEKTFSEWLKQLPVDNVSNSTNKNLITGLTNLSNTYFKNAKHEHKEELEQELKHIYHDTPQKADSALNYLNTTGGNIFDLATKKVALKRTCQDMGKYFDRHQSKSQVNSVNHTCHNDSDIKDDKNVTKVTCLLDDNGKLLAVIKEDNFKDSQNILDKEVLFDKAKGIKHDADNKLQKIAQFYKNNTPDNLRPIIEDFFGNLTHEVKDKVQPLSHKKVNCDNKDKVPDKSAQKDKLQSKPKEKLNKAQVMPADAKTPELKVKRTKQAHRYPDKAAYKYIMRNLKRRGITVKEMAEEAMHDQEKHGLTIGVKEYEQAIYSVLHKRDNMSQIMRGLVLDDLCTAKLLPDPLQYIMENDLSSFSDDEVLGISLTAPYSGIAVTNFGARDVHKSGIAKRLDEDPDHCNVFADDIVSALVGNAEAIVAHKYNF